MPLDFYHEGFEAGEATAAISRKAIKDAGKEGVGALCGKIIEKRKGLDGAPWEVKNSNSWAVGFFDGFLKRADIIFAAGK